MQYFVEATRRLPRDLPVNVIMFPMEGGSPGGGRLLETRATDRRRIPGTIRGLAMKLPHDPAPTGSVRAPGPARRSFNNRTHPVAGAPRRRCSMKVLRRREIEQFSLSFLDVICCGFGAIVLLLIITKTMQPMVLEQTTVDLDGQVAAKREAVNTIQGQTRTVTRADLR